MTTPKRIDLRIHELVLEGIAAHDRARLVSALEQQLAAHLERGEYPTASRGTLAATRAGESSPEAIGGRLATTIATGGSAGSGSTSGKPGASR